MKKTYSQSLLNLCRHEVERLTTTVNETLAYQPVVKTTQTFTSAELWKIQRQSKARPARRFL